MDYFDDCEDADLSEIGYCTRCGAPMAGEQPAAVRCSDCSEDD